MEVVDEDEVEEMELGELDLDVIEEEYGNNGHGYVPRSKLSLERMLYAKLSLQYMERMLYAFGFGPEWVEWVMSLVTTTFFNILLNGSPTKVIHVSQGIRKGDPCSCSSSF